MRAVTFKVFPLSSYAFCPRILPLLETFIVPFFLNIPSVLTLHFSETIPSPEIFVPSKWTLSLERAKYHWGKKSDEKKVFHSNSGFFVGGGGHKLLDRELCAIWGIVVTAEQIFGPEFTPFPTQSFT
jgi:hypothetical protein